MGQSISRADAKKTIAAFFKGRFPNAFDENSLQVEESSFSSDGRVMHSIVLTLTPQITSSLHANAATIKVAIVYKDATSSSNTSASITLLGPPESAMNGTISMPPILAKANITSTADINKKLEEYFLPPPKSTKAAATLLRICDLLIA